MSELWASIVEALGALPLPALLAWSYWPHLGFGLAVFLLGFLFGFWRRTVRVRLDEENVLTAFERVVRGDMQGAFGTLERATQDPSARPEVYFALASLLRHMGHADRSAHMHRALLGRTDLSRALRTRASIGLAADLIACGQTDEAERTLRELPRAVRRQEALLALRKNAAIRAQDWKEALEAGTLLGRRTGSGGEGASEVYSYMAEAALTRGAADEASKAFRKALRKDPSNAHAREGLARIYVAEGKLFRARRLLSDMVGDYPDLAPRILPLMRAALGADAKYRKYLHQLEQEGLASPWVDLELAELAYGAEDYDGALEILEDLVELYPDSMDVHEAYLNLLIAVADEATIFAEVDRFMELAGRRISRFECMACQERSVTAFVRCPKCAALGTARYLT